jgi:hypothetical protein
VHVPLAEHIREAQLFAHLVYAGPGFERVAPVPCSVVCVRAFRELSGTSNELDSFNARLLDSVYANGDCFFLIRASITHSRSGSQSASSHPKSSTSGAHGNC